MPATQPGRTGAHHVGLDVEPAEAIDAHDFRRVLSHFASGITIVTAMVDGVPCGMTCQSFFSLSLDPPLVAFAPAKSSRSYADIRRSPAFCINVLAEAQQDLCGGFARSGTDKFAGVGWTEGRTGSPVLDDVLASIECTVDAEHEAGDHWLVIGRVVALDARDHRPLLFFKGRYQNIVEGLTE